MCICLFYEITFNLKWHLTNKKVEKKCDPDNKITRRQINTSQSRNVDHQRRKSSLLRKTILTLVYFAKFKELGEGQNTYVKSASDTNRQYRQFIKKVDLVIGPQRLVIWIWCIFAK